MLRSSDREGDLLMSKNAQNIQLHQIAMFIRDGRVAVATHINGETSYYEPTQESMPFEFGNKDHGIPNAIAELAQLLDVLNEGIFMEKGHRAIVAVPQTICRIFNNTELITRMLWTGLYILDKKAMNEKTPLSPAEKACYKRAFFAYRNLMGKVILVDTNNVKGSRKPGEQLTQEQETWIKLKDMVNGKFYGKRTVTAINAVVLEEEEDDDLY